MIQTHIAAHIAQRGDAVLNASKIVAGKGIGTQGTSPTVDRIVAVSEKPISYVSSGRRGKDAV